ncbi:MAG: SpoIIE family protein phosphatase [Deltaproteobacteria bacterium]|nr:SpoIIE family protein phosphatase [Deltaproteobacteria bacterium]MDQ3296998.1 SpoIIE family protein phosphatase [Myxococcota bacterium]
MAASRQARQARQARAGIPISVKLILTTSIVIAAAVGTATWFSQTSIGDLTEKQIAARRQSGEQSIKRESVLVVKAVANAVALPLANSAYADITPVLDAAISDDKASGDHRVQWLVVTDDVGTLVQATPGAPDKAKLAELEQLLKTGATAGSVVHARIGSGTSWVYGAPIEVGTRAVGALRIGVTTAGLEQELGASLVQAQVRAEATRNRVWLVSLVVLAIGIVLAALQGVQLARPIKVLTAQAERIAAGDLSMRVPHKRRDELGVLAGAFNYMVDEIQDLLVEQRQKASLEKEMSLARQVQQAMLPPETLDVHGALKVVGYCMPASSCGGDWWTYRKLSNGRMLLVVGDATGHGIHSAMIAATARGAVEALSGIDERLLTPEQVLRAIDSAIRQVGDHNVLMTAFAAVFDSMNGILHYANAGQNFPYVVKLGATRILEDASIIAASGNPLGDRNIAVEIRRGSLQLRPGDLFVCFTDGVVERANPSGKLFGDRRLRSALTGQPLPDGPALARLRDLVVNTLEAYAEGTLAEDDMTLVLCHYDPASVANRESVVGRGVA